MEKKDSLKEQKQKIINLGICKCCGSKFGIIEYNINGNKIFDYACYGEQISKPCPIYTENNSKECGNMEKCELNKIPHLDEHLKSFANILYKMILEELEREKVIGLVIYPNRVVKLVYEKISANSSIKMMFSIRLENHLILFFKINN